MKKTLLLSVVASAFLMAGGDIVPVEAPVAVPVVEASAWNFSGQAVAYYQTMDAFGFADLGSSESSALTAGLQLKANGNLGYGFGAGATLTGLYTNSDWTDFRMADGDGQFDNTSGALTEAYLTYAIGNTSVKVGRQELPKGLSPMAFSEKWNIFSNTFEAALIVNTDISNTTLVGAYVTRANNYGDMSQFTDINEDGVYMLTAQNKSIDALTLTGTYYYAPDFNINGDASIVWGDASYNAGMFNVAGQAGYVFGDAVDGVETTAFGIKAGATSGKLSGSLAYSNVDDGALGIRNLGTGIKTPLYTQMIANQDFISSDNDTFVGKVAYEVTEGGTLSAAYGYSTSDSLLVDDYSELDIVCSKKLGDKFEVLAAYVYSDIDTDIVDTDGNNMVRIWGKYNF